MKYIIGFEDVLMASIKALAENETDKGFILFFIANVEEIIFSGHIYLDYKSPETSRILQGFALNRLGMNKKARFLCIKLYGNSWLTVGIIS